MKPSPSELTDRILVVGAGGLGGITTALLWERWKGAEQSVSSSTELDLEAQPIVALTTNPAIAKAVRERGFTVRTEGRTRSVPAPVVEALSDAAAPFDWIVLAVQPPQVEEAARSVARFLAPAGRMVCFQNGLCEERIERIVGRDRVVGAVVSWGASMPEPGKYERTARGGFTLGMPHRSSDERLDVLARWFDAVGPTKVTANLSGARWSKLAINNAISTLGTLGGGTLGAVMLHRSVRRLALDIMTETVAVARALGISLEKIAGVDLEWLALDEAEQSASGSPSLLAKHSLLLAVGARYRRMRSSMLAAIERGRVPAVDFLNGEVVERGEALGIPTPVNREAQRMVHEMAHGRFKPGIAALHMLRDRAARVSGRAGTDMEGSA